MNEVIKFINHFLQYNPKAIKQTFTEECCYWFAEILHLRFPDSKIVYAPIENHFMTQIGDKVYDITGAVPRSCYFCIIDWDSYDDPVHKERLTKQCITFEEE